MDTGIRRTKEDLSFRDLSDEKLGSFARVLAQRPVDQMARRGRYDQDSVSAGLIRSLPKKMKAPKPFQKSLSRFTHARLNQDLPGTMFQWIQLEIDSSIPALMYALVKGKYISEDMRQ